MFLFQQSVSSALEEIKTWEDYSKFLDKADLKQSLWLGRRIYVKGCSGGIRLLELVVKKQELLRLDPHYSEKERSFALWSCRKINQFFRKDDNIYEKSYLPQNFFYIPARILDDLTSWNSQYAFLWEVGECDDVKYYTAEQFRNKYGIPLPDPKNYITTIVDDIPVYDAEYQLKVHLSQCNQPNSKL